jgi:hypothetical protein
MLDGEEGLQAATQQALFNQNGSGQWRFQIMLLIAGRIWHTNFILVKF